MKNQITKLVFSDWSMNSNKEYNVRLEERPRGFVVTCTYGRRYQANNITTKTKTPVPYNEAVRIYNRIVTQKISKGYNIES